MKRDRDFTDQSEIAAVRLPKQLRREVKKKARDEDLTFSQFARRALRRELGLPLDEKEVA